MYQDLDTDHRFIVFLCYNQINVCYTRNKNMCENRITSIIIYIILYKVYLHMSSCTNKCYKKCLKKDCFFLFPFISYIISTIKLNNLKKYFSSSYIYFNIIVKINFKFNKNV